jgi:hypothetical protein
MTMPAGWVDSKKIEAEQQGGKEEEKKRIEELKKKIKRLQDERDELALMAYMAGNVGDVYLMDAIVANEEEEVVDDY